MAQSTSVQHTPVGLALCPWGTGISLPARPHSIPVIDRQTDRHGHNARLGVPPHPAEENMQ